MIEWNHEGKFLSETIVEILLCLFCTNPILAPIIDTMDEQEWDELEEEAYRLAKEVEDQPKKALSIMLELCREKNRKRKERNEGPANGNLEEYHRLQASIREARLYGVRIGLKAAAEAIGCCSNPSLGTAIRAINPVEVLEEEENRNE